MSTSGPPIIRNVTTGVPGLDAVLGGGLCEYSFNLVAGAPGTGKTTLVQQMLFANATRERPALYFARLSALGYVDQDGGGQNTYRVVARR